MGHSPLQTRAGLVVALEGGALLCLDVRTLTPRWRADLPEPFVAGPDGEGAAFDAGDEVWVGLGARLLRFDVETGAALGEAALPGAANLLGARFTEETLFVTAFCDDGFRFLAIERATWRTRWSVDAPDPYPSLVHAAGSLIARPERTRVVALDPQSGAERWTLDVSELGATEEPLGGRSPGWATEVTDAGELGLLVSTHHAVLRVDPRTGEVRWTWRTPIKATASLAVDGTQAHLLLFDRYVRLDVRNGSAVAERPFGDRRLRGNFGPATLHAGALYANDLLGPTVGIDAATGALSWLFPRKVGMPVTHRPMVAGGRLFTLDLRGHLDVFERV